MKKNYIFPEMDIIEILDIITESGDTEDDPTTPEDTLPFGPTTP